MDHGPGNSLVQGRFMIGIGQLRADNPVDVAHSMYLITAM